MSAKGIPLTPKFKQFVQEIIKARWQEIEEYERHWLNLGMPPRDPPERMYWATTIVGSMKKDRDKSKDAQRKRAILNTPWIWSLAKEMGVSWEPLNIDRNRWKFISLRQPSQDDPRPPKHMVAPGYFHKHHEWPIEKQLAWAMEPVTETKAAPSVEMEKKTSKARDEEYGPS